MPIFSINDTDEEKRRKLLESINNSEQEEKRRKLLQRINQTTPTDTWTYNVEGSKNISQEVKSINQTTPLTWVSSSSSQAEESIERPKKNIFQKTYSAFADPFQEASRRQANVISDAIDTFSRSPKEVLRNPNDLAIRSGLIIGNTFVNALDAIFVPVGAVVSPFIQAASNNPTWARVLWWLSTFLDKTWDIAVEWVNRLLKRDLTETEEENVRFLAWEWVMEVATLWVGKMLGKSIKGVTKKFWDIKISRKEVENSYIKYKKDLKKQATIVEENYQVPEELTEKFITLADSIWKDWISIKEAKQRATDLWLDPEFLVNKLQEIRNNNSYKTSFSAKKVTSFLQETKQRVYKKIKKTLTDYWYVFWKKSKDNKIALKKAESQYWKSDVSKTIDNVENMRYDLSPDASVLNEIFEIQFLKGNDEWFKTAANAYKKARNLKKALDNGLVVKQKWREPDLDWFKLTAKWEKVIREELDLSIYESTHPLKTWMLDKLLQDWFAEIDKTIYNKAVDAAEKWDIISLYEFDQMINDISWDKAYNKLDLLKTKMDFWDTLTQNQYIEMGWYVLNINTKYWLDITDDALKAIGEWNVKVINETFDKIRKLKDNEFITENTIKNSWKNINISNKIGFVPKVFKRLYNNAKTVTKWEFQKSISLLKRNLIKAEQKIRKQYSKNANTMKVMINNLRDQYKANILNLKAKAEWIEWVKQQLKDNLQELKKDPRFISLWINVSKIINKATSPKMFGLINTPKKLRERITQINKYIEAEYARWLAKTIKKELSNTRITNKSKKYKSQTINLEQYIQLRQAWQIFRNLKFWELSIADMEDLLAEIREVKSTWKSLKLKSDIDLSLIHISEPTRPY